MLNQRLTKISRRIITGLRHKPIEVFKKELSHDGFMDIMTVLTTFHISLQDLKDIAQYNDKNRFEIVGTNIRARQGHTIAVDVEFEEAIPPRYLYHGTVESAADIIVNEGINKMTRHHVHLTDNLETAKNVGSRRVKLHNPLVIVTVDAESMHKKGIKFFKSSNGVWLTDYVSPDYVAIL